MSRFLTCFLVIGFLAAAAPAAVSFNWAQVATGVGPDSAYDSYDLQVTTAGDLGLVEMYIESYAPAADDFYINTTDPYFSNEAYDTCVYFPVTMSSLGVGYPADPDANGPAINIVPDDPPGAPIREQSFNNSGLTGVDGLLDFSWGAANDTASGPLTDYVVARVTVKQGLLYGSWQVYGLEIGNETEYTAENTLPGWPLYSALGGDTNLDKSVSIADYAVVLTNYDQSGKTWAEGDFTGEGDVSIADYAIVLTNYTTSYPSEPPSEPSSVPEPTTIVLLAFGAWCLAGRARRK